MTQEQIKAFRNRCKEYEQKHFSGRHWREISLDEILNHPLFEDIK